MTLQARTFVAMLIGAAVGLVTQVPALAPLQRAVLAVAPIGTIFIRLITMVVVPLVIASLFVGIASLGDIRRLGQIGGRTLGYFVGTTLAAALIGLGVAIAAGFGAGPAAMALPSTGAPLVPTPSLIDTIVQMVPQNPFAAAASGDLLPLIIAVCLFAAAATVTPGEGKRTLLLFFEGVNAVMMTVIGWLMRLAPIAVFVLIAGTVAASGMRMLGALLGFALVVIIGLLIHVVIVLLPALRLGARLGLGAFFSRVSDALLLAFSTASSSATLPVSMAAATVRLGVSNEVASFVLPLGATANKNGSATYKAVTAVFLMHWYGVPIGLSQAVAIVITATFAAFAGAGVPGSSLVTTLIVLNAIGLGANAAAGIAVVAAIDRPLDMCRTTVNTISNLIGAAWVARSQGERLTTS